MVEQDRSEQRRPLRAAFTDDLYRIMADKRISQRQLGIDLELSSHSIINRWRHGVSEPDPEMVFAIEELLDVAPGSLSAHLGYLPLTAAKSGRVDVLKAIEADAVLPEWGKEIMRTSYREIIRSLGRGRRR